MRYLGGKSKTAKSITEYLNIIRKPHQPYWEAFVGSAWILQHIKEPPIFSSDYNEYLIAMWQALQQGWIPPDTITEQQYNDAKNNGLDDKALLAFIGFGCSFAGKWFNGYARGKNRNYANSAKNSLLKKLSKIHPSTTFYHADFLTVEPPAKQCLIYCDPPYNNTTQYDAVGEFDTDKFWDRVRWLETDGHTVIVSEYQAPDDFSCVLEIPTTTGINTINGKEPRIERLFRYGQHNLYQSQLSFISQLSFSFQ